MRRPARSEEPLPPWVPSALRLRETAPPDPALPLLEDVRLLAEDLALPEGPVALADGSVLLVEIRRGTLCRVADGQLETVADLGGGPNGAAIGPDAAVYVCNNGRRYPDYDGGRIERVELATGEATTLYAECEGRRLIRPNDLVFDSAGTLWFTDFGGEGPFGDPDQRLGSIYRAAADGGEIAAAATGIHQPNGIALSPDESTLYFTQTASGRIYQRAITAPGELEQRTDNDPAALVCGLPGLQMFDGIALEQGGGICAATLVSGLLTVVDPAGGEPRQLRFPPGFDDVLPTNICFGGRDRRTAFITLGQTGRLVSCSWPLPGAELAFTN